MFYERSTLKLVLLLIVPCALLHSEHNINNNRATLARPTRAGKKSVLKYLDHEAGIDFLSEMCIQ